MTSDFRPGKAYLIEGKSIEQVKSEIKEWLAKNEIDIVYEDSSTVEGFKFSFLRYPIRVNVQLLTDFSGVILIFNNPKGIYPRDISSIEKYGYTSYEYLFKYFPIFMMIPRVLLGEYFSNMVRFISGKKEIYLNLDLFDFLYCYGLLFIFIFFYIFLNIPLLSKVITLSGSQYGFFIIYLILMPMIVWIIVKNISLSDKYYIEEYKGEIEID